MTMRTQLEQLGAVALSEEVAGILDVDSDFPELVDAAMEEVLAAAEDGMLDGRFVGLSVLGLQLDEMLKGRRVRVEFRSGHPWENQPLQGTWMNCGAAMFELKGEDGRTHLIGYHVCGWLELLDDNDSSPIPSIYTGGNAI